MKNPNAVTIDAELPKPPEPLATKLYELRVLDGSPVQNLNVPTADERGDKRTVTFAKFRGVPRMDEFGNFTDRPLLGLRQPLTDAMLDGVKRWIAARAVLRAAPNAGVYEFDSPLLKHRVDVELLARYVSIVEVTDEKLADEGDVSVTNALGETVGG